MVVLEVEGLRELIEVGHLIKPSGEIRQDWKIRKHVSYNGYQRTQYNKHPKLLTVLDEYFDWRVERQWGTTNLNEYRTLDPDSKLILNDNGEACHFTKRKVGDKVHKQPTGVNRLFSDFIKRTKLDGVTYRTLRKSYIIQLHRERLSVRSIMAITGIRDYESVSKVIRSDARTIEKAIDGIYVRL